ncbi:hypothetical protein [Spiroplasma cantharicola]|nr:hypothetical protein [Spiroplasma cantharicola]
MSLKYCENNDLRPSLWIITPCFTIIGILIVVFCLIIISNTLITAIIISLSWGIILGIILGVSYYKTRKRIIFKRKGDLL